MGVVCFVGGPKDIKLRKEETRVCLCYALGFMKETRQVQTGCCPINCISTNIMYSNNKQTKQCIDRERWGCPH